MPRPCFERETHEVYALGEIDTREAILLFNDQTRLTAENTIEYMIYRQTAERFVSFRRFSL